MWEKEKSKLQTKKHEVACTHARILASQGIADHYQVQVSSRQPASCASVGSHQASSAPGVVRTQRFPNHTARAEQILNSLKVRIASASMTLMPWIRL